MNLELNRKKETRDTANGKRPYLIAAAILAVFVVHFAWQFTFVQKENLRIAENSLNNAQIEVAPVEVQPVEETAAVEPEPPLKKTAAKETAKSVIAVKYAPPENKLPLADAKKPAAREPRSARLRRAEKLLTGF